MNSPDALKLVILYEISCFYRNYEFSIFNSWNDFMPMNGIFLKLGSGIRTNFANLYKIFEMNSSFFQYTTWWYSSVWEYESHWDMVSISNNKRVTDSWPVNWFLNQISDNIVCILYSKFNFFRANKWINHKFSESDIGPFQFSLQFEKGFLRIIFCHFLENILFTPGT